MCKTLQVNNITVNKISRKKCIQCSSNSKVDASELMKTCKEIILPYFVRLYGRFHITRSERVKK